jgi:hypothetical protein
MKNTIITILIIVVAVLLWTSFRGGNEPEILQESFTEESSLMQEQNPESMIQDIEPESNETYTNEPEESGVTTQPQESPSIDEECTSNDCPAEDGEMIIYIPVFDGSDIVMVRRYVPESQAVLDSVYTALFNAPTTVLYGEFENHSQGRNSVPSYGVDFDSVAINSGVAQVYLTGTFEPQAPVSDFNFRQQINEAAFQYDTVDSIQVFLNGNLFDWCIADMSGGENGCPNQPRYWFDQKN